jgi:hypothetical protein
MRWGPRAITALLALACAWGAACGSGGGGDSVTIITQSPFPQGFLPVLGGTGRGDVASRFDEDLFAVDGSATRSVKRVSRLNGDVTTFATVNDASSLLSIAVGLGDDTRIFVGDSTGSIWAIPADGSSPEELFDTGSNAVTGLAIAPAGFGDLGGSLFAAAGDSGIWRIPTGNPAQSERFDESGDSYVDLVFSGTTLLAINATLKKIETVSPSGEAAPLPSTPNFTTPVGLTVDLGTSEIYVADAGDGDDATPDSLLYTVPVTGGARTARAAYHFDPDAPSGLAYDGRGAIAFVTTDPPAIRGSTLPRIDPNFGLAFFGPTVGYGDLEFDRLGAFVLAANDLDDSPNNFLIGVSRDGTSVTVLASGVGSPLEELLGVAVDPKQQVIYFSTRRGNVYRRASDGAVTLLVSASSSAVLGLELAPQGFGAFAGHLIATTSDGHVFAIDPASPTPPVPITLTPPLTPPISHLSDLVFSTDGVLYVVDNNGNTSRILNVHPDGTVDVLAPSTQLGRADGIEIDEGGDRLLVASETAGGGQLLSVDLRPAHLGEVRALANFSISIGFFPTGVVYDRLGTAVLHAGNNVTTLDAVPVALPLP